MNMQENNVFVGLCATCENAPDFVLDTYRKLCTFLVACMYVTCLSLSSIQDLAPSLTSVVNLQCVRILS